MNDTARRLLTNALQLPEADRAELAASLIDSLDDPADNDADSAWDEEIQQRLSQIHRGEVSLLSFDEARERLFGKVDGQPGT
ncbi:MAG: addiction module protein [Pirellulales bacterium]